MNTSTSLVWFRRDLRDFDHAALYHALKSSHHVYCVFVFDQEILDQLKNKQDRRVEFIWESVLELKTKLQSHGSDLIVKYGIARDEVVTLAKLLKVNTVFSNRDYEPSAIARDAYVKQQLDALDIDFEQFKDHVIFEQDEVLTLASKPYSVFTPYKNSHLKKLNDYYLKAYPVEFFI